MYEQIASNKRKSFFLVLFFLLLIFALAWVFSELTELGPAGLVLAAVLAVAMTFGSYYSSTMLWKGWPSPPVFPNPAVM